MRKTDAGPYESFSSFSLIAPHPSQFLKRKAAAVHGQPAIGKRTTCIKNERENRDICPRATAYELLRYRLLDINNPALL